MANITSDLLETVSSLRLGQSRASIKINLVSPSEVDLRRARGYKNVRLLRAIASLARLGSGFGETDKWNQHGENLENGLLPSRWHRC